MATMIKNGKIVLPDRILEHHVLTVEDGIITGIFPETSLPDFASPSCCVDARGQYVSPGFLDIHVHGGGGVEANCGTLQDVLTMARAHASYGTTSILPTTFASPLSDIYATIDVVREAQKQCEESNILGIHLEGPYFAPSQCGAQNPAHLISPRPEDYLPLLDYWKDIKIVGAAVELDGALDLGRELKKRGILASIAHCDATFEQVEEAMRCGYSDVTHLYSACSTVKRVNAYRVAGLVEAGLFFDDLTVQIIADGKHLPASLLRLIYKCKGADRIALVTDGLCASATQMQEGEIIHQANGVDMVYEDGVFKLLHRQSFAGSAATSSILVKNMCRLAEVPLWDAVKMAATTPAQMIGANQKGSLAVGKDADIILFDQDITVSFVMVNGKITKDACAFSGTVV